MVVILWCVDVLLSGGDFVPWWCHGDFVVWSVVEKCLLWRRVVQTYGIVLLQSVVEESCKEQ